jgi:tetratricopeptide (TPR) repeat protein
VSAGVLGPVVIFLVAAAGVAVLQPHLARAAHAAGEREDVYALPPPGQLHAATLGWDAAAVDLLWSDLLVQYGTHWSEHREFDDAGRFADAILEIEPGYMPLYKLIDTLLVYRPMQGTARDARAAKAYMEKGTREHPDSAELWLRYGQFLAYSGSSFLSDPAEQQAWREQGAVAMERAVDLGAKPNAAINAASLLSRNGQVEAALEYLERAYANTDHPSMTEVHDLIGAKIQGLLIQLHQSEPAPLPVPYR